jgi:hypothetical protein
MTAYAVRERDKVEERSSNAVQEASPAVSEAPTVPSCAHYWIIEPADGPVSRGMCQICSEERDFKNFVDSYSSQED